MTIHREFTPRTKWARWACELARRSDAELTERDVDEVNLRCAEDLPGTDNEFLGACLKKLDDWTALVDRFTRHIFSKFFDNPGRFQGSEARFRVVAMVECLQRHAGIHYNQSFAEGDYDASDSRNLFIHGVLTGFGGTCASMPVLYCAIGRRLSYPLSLAETNEHFFCRWDDDRGEHFCFDATGRGCAIHGEDYYRRWPRRITPSDERNNGWIRGLTRREELAAFAATRGNCLFDNFQFPAAIEAYYLAHKIAPHKACLHDAWGLAVYSAKLWARLSSFPKELYDTPVEQAIQPAAEELTGPSVEHFREPAVQNVLRILRNHRRRVRASVHAAAIRELVTQ